MTEPNVLEELRAKTAELVEALRRDGAEVDTASVVALSFDTLVDLLLPFGAPFRHLYDVQRELRLQQWLEEAQQSMARRKLTEGVQLELPFGGVEAP